MNRDLALGKAASFKPFAPLKNKDIFQQNNSSITDGIYGDLNDTSKGWVVFRYGYGREIFLDLEDIYSINSIEIGFLHHRENGFFCPTDVNFLLSENGNDFYEVASVDAPYPPSFDMCVCARYKHRFTLPVKARYLKVNFHVDIYVGVDCLKVFGDNCNGLEEALVGTPVAADLEKQDRKESAFGIANMACVTYGLSENCETVSWSADEFLPYLTYMDNSGKAKDKMFDSLAFCYSETAPSGGNYGYRGIETNIYDWEFLINELFSFDKNLSALDDAVAMAKKALNLPADYQYKIFLTAPVPKVSLNLFGDYNGDGIEDKILTTEDCVSAYIWFVEEASRRFKAMCFNNITLEGWLWNHPTLSADYRDDEIILATNCVSALHERSYKCLFAPHYTEGGLHRCQSVGFDMVAAAGNSRFDNFEFGNTEDEINYYTETCEKFAFGVALELFENCLNPSVLGKYLGLLQNNNFPNGAFCLVRERGDKKSLLSAAISQKSSRNVYDRIYSFINGEIISLAEEIKEEMPIDVETEEPLMEEITDVATPCEAVPPVEIVEPENIEIPTMVESFGEIPVAEVKEISEVAPEKTVEIQEEIKTQPEEKAKLSECKNITEPPHSYFKFDVASSVDAEPFEGVRFSISKGDEDGTADMEGVSELIIRFDPEEKSPEPTEKLAKKPVKNKSYGKKIAIGTGIAAALGAAYIIKKLLNNSEKD